MISLAPVISNVVISDEYADNIFLIVISYMRISILNNNIKIIIMLTIFSVCFWWSSYAEQTLDLTQISSYIKVITADIDKTYEWIKSDERNVHIIMQRVCNNIIDKDFNLWTITFVSKDIYWNIISQTTYKAQESVFVTIVCNSVLNTKNSKDNREKRLPMNTLIKQPTIWSLGLACMTEDNTIALSDPNCEKRARQNNTDFPYIFYNLSSKIFNDIINLMMARVYGAINIQSDEKNLANSYMINYFNTIAFLPESKSYPQSYNKLKEYIKIWQNMQRSTHIINTQWIEDSWFEWLDQWKLFLSYSPDNTQGTNEILDTLPTYQGVSIDILYNELFFYTLFNQIYTTYLERYRNSKENLPITLQSYDIKSAIAVQRSRIQSQEQSLLWSIEQSIRQVNTTISLFPLHIGMLMYQEDVLKMRNNLAKIYLPIHQLHYKLENIQSKE